MPTYLSLFITNMFPVLGAPICTEELLQNVNDMELMRYRLHTRRWTVSYLSCSEANRVQISQNQH